MHVLPISFHNSVDLHEIISIFNSVSCQHNVPCLLDLIGELMLIFLFVLVPALRLCILNVSYDSLPD